MIEVRGGQVKFDPHFLSVDGICAIGQALDASACGVVAEVEGGGAVMFRRDTVFIVGAGASSEVGLPVGSELATRISDLMRFEIEFGQMTKGDDEIFAAWAGHFQDIDKLNEHMLAARRISDGIFLGSEPNLTY